MAEGKPEVKEQKYTGVVFTVENGSKEDIDYTTAKGESLTIKAGNKVSLKKRDWGVGELARLTRMRDVAIGGPKDHDAKSGAKSPESGGEK